MSAANAAELFLSPHIAHSLLIEATREEGPTHWIVNRSDVFDESLEILSDHPIEAVASRAQQKLLQRRHPQSSLLPPAFEGRLDEIPPDQGDHEVEEILGHPLCPFEAMIHYSYSIKDEHRASSALSLSRRLLEYPPEENTLSELREPLIERFGTLLKEDPSPLVRSYCSRIPLLPKKTIEEAFESESEILIAGRLIQSLNSSVEMLQEAAQSSKAALGNGHVQCLIALDKRLDNDRRGKIVQDIGDKNNYISEIHRFYLA